MHVTLHLTTGCNMNCRYCYVDRQNVRTMTPETACAAVDLAARLTPEGGSSGVVFFGGEPLLQKQLIYETVSYTKRTGGSEGSGSYHFKITTNGLLLDDAFLEFAKRHRVFIALSLDGTGAAHDAHRVDASGAGTHARVEEAAKRLLAAFPYSPAMMTVNPDTAPMYCDSVRHLYGLGFRYIVCTLNYAADWTEADMETLRRQYRRMAEFYRALTLREEKFYLSPFEVKISSHVNRKTYRHERCELGKKQVSVGPDGRLYPCVQFVGDDAFCIGSVAGGIDEARRESLFSQNEQEKETCRDCAIRDRCNHHCGCLNRQATGSIDSVSPVLCAHERLLLPIADRLAERLYKKRSAMFIQKHYNDFYPIVSLVEDRITKK